MSLCSRCQQFDIQAFAKDGFRARGYPLAAVIRAGRVGKCSFCSMLLDHFIESDEFDLHSHLNREVRKKEGKSVPVPWISWQSLSVVSRRTIAAIVPVWVHFTVKRGNEYASTSEDALTIVQITAFVSSFLDTWSWDSARSPSISLLVSADQGTPALTSGDITGRLSLDQHTWSWAHFWAISKWHQNCRLGHGDCNSTLSRCEKFDVENAPLPTRCVEFDLVDKDNPWTSPLTWILRETKGQTGKYMALSHRWGDDTEAARTLKNNYACRTNQCTHEPGFHWTNSQEKITNLFYEAGTLAYHLGIRYVWIDSVCIVQDDGDDWKQESVKMADYYQHAWLTIAATTTSGPGGFVGRSEDKADIPRVTRLPYRDRNGEQKGHFYVQAAGGTAIAKDYKKNISNSNLLKRGWVYQEWMLSRRILAFSRSGLFLQCQSAAPKTLDGHDVFNRREGKEPTLVDLAFKEAMKLDLSTSAGKTLAAWENVVQTFSGLQITKLEEDRLVALGGVSQEFGQAMASQNKSQKTEASQEMQVRQYACGLWTNWLRGLQWEQVHPGPRLRLKGIPTWSWASIASTMEVDERGEIPSGLGVQWAAATFPHVKQQVVCTFVTAVPVKVDPVTWEPQYLPALDYIPKNAYGNDNRFVILEVNGRMLPVVLGGPFDAAGDADIAAKMTDHHPSFGRNMWRRISMCTKPETITGWASVEHPAYHPDEANPPTDRVFAFVIARLAKVEGGYGFGNLAGLHVAFKVLFLRKVDIPGRNECYERVGVGRLFGSAVDRDFESAGAMNINLV